MFSLEKLKVYDRALVSVASLAQLSAHWDKRHAVVDQLQRASESVPWNIAEIQLSHRMGEVSVEAAERGLALVDRVALLVRGLAGNT